jgi:outer membrane protein assembly factor BamB
VLNAKTGQVLWKKWLTDYVDAQPAVYGNSVFLTYHPTFRSYSYLERRSLETGNLLWQLQFPGKPISAAVIEKDKVYVSSSNGTVECCDAGTGKLIWNQPMEASSAPLPINGKVIVSQDPVRTRKRSSFGYDGHRPAIAANAVVKIVGNSIEADDVESGREIWKTDLDVAICKKGLFGPAVGKQDVYLTTGSGYIIELDAKSGKERKCYFTKQSFDSQPCLAQGNLYAGTADGRLVCFPMGNDADGWNCWGGNPQHNI